MQRERALILAALVLLAGCASSGSSDTGVKPRKGDVGREAQESAALQVKLGQGYLTEGDLETARDKLRRALELNPNSADAHTLMAVLSERINRPQQAEAFYKRATELKPEDGAVSNNYGAFLCSTGRFEEAEPYFLRALEDPFYRTPAVATANAGVCAVKAGQMERGEAYLRQTIELEPKNVVALFELARLHLAKGDNLRARAFLQRYEAEAGATLPEALELGALIEGKIGNTLGAANYRSRLQQEFPQYTPAPAETRPGSEPDPAAEGTPTP